MGNELSTPETERENATDLQAEPIPEKLQNGGPVGQPMNISVNGFDDAVCLKTDVQQNSALPSSSETKEMSPRSEKEGDDGRKNGRVTLSAAKSNFSMSFAQLVPGRTEAKISTDPSPPPPPNGMVPIAQKAMSLNLSPPPSQPDPTSAQEESPAEGPQVSVESKISFFDKLFKQEKDSSQAASKVQPQSSSAECNSVSPPEEAPLKISDALCSEPTEVQKSTVTLQKAEGKSGSAPAVNGTTQSSVGEQANQQEGAEEDTAAEDHPVMNFFKTLVTPSKTPKAEPDSPDVSKEKKKASEVSEGKGKAEKEQKQLKMEKASGAQSSPQAAQDESTKTKEQESPAKPKTEKDTSSPFSMLFRQKTVKEIPQAKTNGEQDVDAASPLKATKAVAPPEAAKGDSKADSAAKSQKTSQKEAPKEAASEPETPVKQKPAKDTSSPFSKLFRPKAEVDAKSTVPEMPTEPEPPKEEEKKPSKSNFISFFKTKSVKEEENETDSAEVNGKDSDPTTLDKREKAAQASAAVEAASPKPKEEPKSQAEAEKKKSGKQESLQKAKTLEVPQDSKSVSETSQNGEDNPRKIEKRNSIGVFFKGLGPKRLSEVGVQTDPVTITYPTEKSK
ncbi:breast carcinoma-amplified sequence 1 isoform X2 [Amia ocellicauda]|uniref:breast carcinoma-amplified sequence 1 isoform X2 n=1 Tax=Amia ocellicauda TaxID=2972642 RepID=UPI003463CA28